MKKRVRKRGGKEIGNGKGWEGEGKIEMGLDESEEELCSAGTVCSWS